MGNKRNKQYLSGKTKRIYRKNSARMWQIRNSENEKSNIVYESDPVQRSGNKQRVPLAEIQTSSGNEDSDKLQNLTCNLMDEEELIVDKENTNENEATINGYRLVDFMYMFEQCQELAHHNSPFGCNFSNLKITGEYKNGFHSYFYMVCRMCNAKLKLENCRSPKSSKDLTLNQNIVSSFMTIGTGFSALEQVTTSLDIPCMSEHLYAKCHAKVCELWELAKEKSIEEAAKEEFELAVKNGDVNADGVPMITVVADACWSKRSYRKNYTALSGAAVIIGYRTKKVLYMAVKNKYCMICARAQNRNLEVPEHVCYKNHTGSSSSMESIAIVEGFKSSLTTQGLIYSKLIADGDSSTYKNILDAKPYGALIVEKIECSNHLLRNFCTKLDELSKNTCYQLKWRKVLAQNVLRLRRSVKGAINHISSQIDKSFADKVINLKQDLLNAPNHVFGNHRSCQPYFCKYIPMKESNQIDDNVFREMKSDPIFAAIMKIICRLINNAKSLMYNVNSNIAEVYNSIVAKIVGGKRINYSLRQSYSGRCAASVVSFNSKMPQTYICKKIIFKSPNPQIERLEMRRNTKRMSNLKRRFKKSYSIKSNADSSDKDYGDTCKKPDLSETDFAFAKSMHMSKIQLCDEDRQALERRTVLQADSVEWLQERKLRLTASNFGKNCKRGLIKCGPLVKNLLNPKGDLSHIKSIQHGNEHEPIALNALSSVLKGQEGFDSNIVKCGLFVDPEFPFLAASPDGLYKDDTIIEVKCPYSAKEMSVEEGIKKKKINFWKEDKRGNFVLNKNHNWHYQVQGQLHVTRKDICFFAVWTSKDIKVEKILRDDEFWKKNMEGKLEIFYFNCLLPEIIDSRLDRKMEIKEPDYILKALDEKDKVKNKRKITNNDNISTIKHRKSEN